MQCDLGHISQMVWHGCEVPNNFKRGSCDDAMRRGEDEILGHHNATTWAVWPWRIVRRIKFDRWGWWWDKWLKPVRNPIRWWRRPVGPARQTAG